MKQHHARINLNCDDFLGLLQQQVCKVPSTRTNFQHNVSALYSGFVHNSSYHIGVLKDVLAS
jgi:hypothetical protein